MLNVVQLAKITSSKVVAFNVPQTEHEVVRVQVDESAYFYDQLHQHPEIQVMYIVAGQGTLIAGDYVGRFQIGDVFVIGSGQPHVFRCDQSYYRNTIAHAAKSISLYFSEKYFGRELWNANELVSFRELAADCQRGIQLLGQAAGEAAAIIHQLSVIRGIEKVIRFFSLLDLLIKTRDKKALSIQSGRLRVSDEGRMNSIVEFTFRESARKIYLEEVARVANLSAESFCRYFKLHTRKTYITFLNEVRVSHACQLLIQKEISIQEVCYQAGFSNVSNFNRIFRKLTKKTPHAFRQQLPFPK